MIIICYVWKMYGKLLKCLPTLFQRISRCSSGVEHRIRNATAVGSIPTTGFLLCLEPCLNKLPAPHLQLSSHYTISIHINHPRLFGYMRKKSGMIERNQRKASLSFRSRVFTYCFIYDQGFLGNSGFAAAEELGKTTISFPACH
jgi:hypothetical protein